MANGVVGANFMDDFAFRKVDRLAAWLQVPYVLWVTFAAYLNFGVWMLNR